MDLDRTPADFTAFWGCILNAQCYDLRTGGQIFINNIECHRTAVIVEPRSKHPMLEPCIRNCMKAIGEGWNLTVFTWDTEYVRNLFPGSSFQIEKTPAPNFTSEEYSAYLMSERFWNTIKEATIVVFQTDVVFFRSIPEQFLEYDYAGANYFVSKYISKKIGGIQGGFSIRKKKAMLECLQRIPIKPPIPEDVYFTHACEQLGLYVPPIEERRLLAIEAEYYDKPCAFHGFTQSYYYFPLEHCYELVDNSFMLRSYKSAALYHVVVARYHEDLGWLSKYDPVSVIVYNKGELLSANYKTVTLPNVGRESHSYLTYIIDNYDCLPEVVFFTQGSITDHTECKNVDFIDIEDYSPNWEVSYFTKGLTPDGHIGHYNGDPTTPAECSGLEWFSKHIDPEVDVTEMKIWYGSIFSVKRRYVRSRPVSFYKTLLDQLAVSRQPEVGHFMERSWFYILNCHR